MKGPSLSTATALLLLVLTTVAETAVIKSTTTTSGTVPSTTKASGTTLNATTIPAVPTTTTTSGGLPSTTKSPGTVPTTTITSRRVPSATKAPGNETLCPKTCTCDFHTDSLEMYDCSTDPSYPDKQLNAIFDKYPNTTKLVIRSSHLNYLSRSVCHLKNLRTLNLNHNELNTIPWDCLKDLKELREIIVSYNGFTGLGQAMHGFQSLEKLYADHNQINFIDKNVFRKINDMPQLREINLQSNLLTSLDSWPMLGNQTAINLDHNRISSFTNHAQSEVRCNDESTYNISMKRNNITHLTDMLSAWGITDEEQQTCVLRKSKAIDLDHNPFICDCVDYDLYKIIQTMTRPCFGGTVICAKPQDVYRWPVNALRLERVSCSIHEGCPERCNCSQIPYQQAMLVNCSGLNLQDKPGNVPDLPVDYSYNLDYSRNRFEIVENITYFNFVRQAVFSHNAISRFTKDALLTLENVTELYIDNNQLLYLPENILGVVNFTDAFHMRLAGNEWMCDCYAKETRKWLLKMGTRIMDPESIICNSPEDVKGRHMLQMTDAELKCGYIVKPDYLYYFGIGVATVAVWMVILGVPYGILYANRLTLFRKYGWHMFNNDECYGEFKEFDIFLAYGEVNVEYAMGKLFVELENKGYKVAYHRINFIGGKPIKVNIEECIRKSKRTITVISKRFFDSEWCRCELMTALDIDKKQNTKRQIGILLEEIDDVPELDPRVKKFIKTDHCLRLGQDLFEEKMEYMLARVKLKDQKNRRPTVEQLRGRQHRPRPAPANVVARNPDEDPLRPPPPAAPAAGAAAAAAGPAVLNAADTARLLDNQQ